MAALFLYNLKNFTKYSFLISTLLLCGLMFLFLHNLSPKFKKTEHNYECGRAINLSKNTSKQELSALLVNNGYVSNSKDADFIADTLTARLQRLQYPNLFYLQKRAYGKVPAVVADSAGVLIKELKKSKKRIGFDENVKIPLPSRLSSTLNLQKGDGDITVEIFSDDNKCVTDVVVKVVEYFFPPDSVPSSVVVGYVKTDSLGVAKIQGLDMTKGYSVLPLKYGFEYGSSKGVRLGDFKKFKFWNCFWRMDYVFKFEQLEHRIQLIDNATLKQIKTDGSITVRTPSEYKSEVVKWFVLVLLAWWALAFVMVRRKKNFDTLLLSSVMFLTGLCVIVMFSIQNPLTEDLRGVEMASAVIIGLVCVLLLQFVDFIKLYQSSYKLEFDMPKQIFRLRFLPKGTGWLVSAILLNVLLWTPLGRSVGGMTVNLSLFGLLFQPSEIAKYLIIFFMAAFFTQNADSIIKYSQPDKTNIRAKIKTLGWIIGGLILLILLYGILGDMGPALVIGVTFLLLYSLVKSKVNLDNLTEYDKWKRILTCDFAVLIYGVISFAAFLLIGYMVGKTICFAIIWFVFWVVIGFIHHRQFFESAFVFNLLVFAFVFGGQVLSSVPVLSETDTAERFEKRTQMCVNTWGVLDIENHGKNAKPVSNSQVANGLWAIASGGMTGQGLGDGNPNLIPAFHTDMILSSIGEQMGWLGLLLIVVVLGVMLRRMVVIGYKVKHPFAFYFCSGVAIVIGVQFFIIALGGSGMIPLTGISVPFLSYGRVSMILNLVAVGVVLSLSKNVKEYRSKSIVQQRSVGDYNFPVSIVSWTFVVISFIVLEVWQYYALWRRGDTLINPVLVERNGLPLIEYNPRIDIITSAMWAGNVYDRNNVLLATSNNEMLYDTTVVLNRLIESGICKDSVLNIARAHTKRYYPFKEQMFFMLGDQNTKLFFYTPIGYMTESRHLSKLRGYNLHPVKLEELRGVVNKYPRYIKYKGKNGSNDTILAPTLENYEDLIPILKSGINGSSLSEHNRKVANGEMDLKLTVDAALQTELQNNLKLYVEKGYDRDGKPYEKRRSALDKNKLLRISVVVLNAETGDLLTSANYPLPDYERIMSEDSIHHYYTDNRRGPSWRAYTDMDLGLLYESEPGSTAKIMSSMAGLNKLGTVNGCNTKFDIQLYEVIDYNSSGSSAEPPMDGKRHDVVDMRRALVVSSNCYFIDLVNEYNLYKELQEIYAQTGVSVKERSKHTYGLIYPEHLDISVLEKVVNEQQDVALTSWYKYTQDKNEGKFDNDKDKKELRKDEWMWAWGQEMYATPLAMARVVSAVTNDGKMPVTRFLLDSEISTKSITSKSSASAIKGFMKQQYIDNVSKKHLEYASNIGGKTGTPQRGYGKRNVNDGWYVFYVDNKKPLSNIAVAVRMERIGLTVDKEGRRGMSTDAMWLSREVVIPALVNHKYIVKQY